MTYLSAVPLAVLLLGASSFTLAGSSQDLTVKGIITPSACAPMVSGDGTVDFGKVSVRDLNPDTYTDLPRETMLLSVRCEGPTFFTLNTIDNRAGTTASHFAWHGLGVTANDEKVGDAGLGLYRPVADGVPVRTITSRDGGVTWMPSVMLSHTLLTAVADNDGLAPIAVQALDAEIRLITHIAPASSLTLTDEVPIDGHATVQVNYL
ncbi:hypothetical protein [Pseudomonas sp. 31 R 17]|jgi:type 1 fimbria pilin|uniref:DUF1120 domain-containing protein n=1 Tax=Pseudomonas TaxID=286 RepID=UPI0008128D50|nr:MULTISPECIES: DUF1120 domain-containing protein [Pseudomonas]MDO4236363.1 DUF1120 domain-containing protein [Pseudomonas sp.]RZI22884.1 DUF1120 domain-containing protein [Pseudomonas orientalis]CRM42742.1 hypothetical protein [Pseudomonas sp. 28 E 9]CRM46026.1 hypothetical protein [Pseudomonas sp. 31 R 17]